MEVVEVGDVHRCDAVEKRGAFEGGALRRRGALSRPDGRRVPTPRDSSRVVSRTDALYAAATTIAPPCIGAGPASEFVVICQAESPAR